MRAKLYRLFEITSVIQTIILFILIFGMLFNINGFKETINKFIITFPTIIYSIININSKGTRFIIKESVK